MLGWLTLGLIVKSFVPAAWLGFSLTYSRGDYRESLARWRIPLAIVALLPDRLIARFPAPTPRGGAGRAGGRGVQLRFSRDRPRLLNVILLVALVWILMNLEQTFRSAVGTMRWRIKFVVLGLAVIFGARLYVRSQALLFSAYDMHWPGIESSAPPDRVCLPGGGLRAHRIRRDRRVPLTGRPGVVR